MDVDAFIAVHAPEWETLAALVRKRRRTGAEIDQLVSGYQRAATHLSQLRSARADATVIEPLSVLVARARIVVTAPNDPWTVWMRAFWGSAFPAALYRSRWWSLASALFTVVVATALGTWIAQTPRVLNSIGTPADRSRFVNTSFEAYYSEHPASLFATNVWTNNAWVAALCVALGITGAGVVYVLWGNAVNVGMAGGLMASQGKLGLFFSLIAPHGLLELTCVFVASGAGLQLFWAWVAPGARTRTQALASEGRAMITVALGLIAVLAVAGTIEGFVTPSPLPVWLKIGLGFCAWAGFLTYIGVVGRAAYLAGETGDLRSGLVQPDLAIAG